MSEPTLPDALERFLQSPPSAASDAALQQAILQQTLAMLPPRRGWRRVFVASAIAASIGLAFVAGWFLARAWMVLPTPRQEIVEHKKQEPIEKPQPPQAVPTPLSADPRDLEWTAFDTMEDHERTRLYFRAGDLYLEKHNDVASAMRCYKQALASSNAKDLEFSANDNGLVVHLKHDYQKDR